MPILLVIDDETPILHAFTRVFRPPDVQLLTATTAAEGLALVEQHRPDTVILDINLPDQSGLAAYGKLRQIDARVPVLFITGLGTTDQAIEAMKLGAFDFLLKPLDIKVLRTLVHKAFEISRLMRVPALVAEQDAAAQAGSSDVLVGRCPAMQEVYKAIGRVAPQNVTVLVLGESGTGKELVARAIYQHSRRATRRSSRSTAPPSPRRCWRASCSAMRKARSPAPSANGLASSSSAPAARCSSTRSATCRR